MWEPQKTSETYTLDPLHVISKPLKGQNKGIAISQELETYCFVLKI